MAARPRRRAEPPRRRGKPLTADVITPTAVTHPATISPGSLDGMVFAAFYASLYRPANGNCARSIPPAARPEDGITAQE
jgi:hypothetical protein